jgi:lipoprotein-anchoring transpeptidase ErfK/SrfK
MVTNREEKIMSSEKLTSMSRRAFVIGLPLGLSACISTVRSPATQQQAAAPVRFADPRYVEMYASMPNERFPVPAIDVSEIEPRFFRQRVEYAGSERVGEVVVDPVRRFLYLVQEGGQAMRYGVGVGQEGLEFQGSATIRRKAEWPSWTPTPAMIRRDPERNAPYAGGMPGGLENPLGARALYLYQNGRDTMYRIHGTNEPWSIGRSVSSGCIRMFNQDVIDLYRRVPTGTRVTVLGQGARDRTRERIS